MHRNTTHTSEITVRLADHTDSRALLALAALDSAQVPAGALVVAESDGELVAAVPVDGGRAIADPFRGTDADRPDARAARRADPQPLRAARAASPTACARWPGSSPPPRR